MRAIEKTVFAIRHSKHLERNNWLWNSLRPAYDLISKHVYSKGLHRVINGTDAIFVSPRCRAVAEQYEPRVWRSLLAEVRPGDVVVDVGAFIGLYTVALARRTGMTGRVFALEPDERNFEILRENVGLNHLDGRIELLQFAAAAHSGSARFESNASESHIISDSNAAENDNRSDTVRCLPLDTIFSDRRVDVMKVDVEGYEELTIRGALDLLSDPARRPRALFVEVHPYAWPSLGTTSDSLLRLLTSNGYRVVDLAERPIERIEEYGQIIARVA